MQELPFPRVSSDTRSVSPAQLTSDAVPTYILLSPASCSSSSSSFSPASSPFSPSFASAATLSPLSSFVLPSPSLSVATSEGLSHARTNAHRKLLSSVASFSSPLSPLPSPLCACVRRPSAAKERHTRAADKSLFSDEKTRSFDRSSHKLAGTSPPFACWRSREAHSRASSEAAPIQGVRGDRWKEGPGESEERPGDNEERREARRTLGSRDAVYRHFGLMHRQRPRGRELDAGGRERGCGCALSWTAVETSNERRERQMVEHTTQSSPRCFLPSKFPDPRCPQINVYEAEEPSGNSRNRHAEANCVGPSEVYVHLRPQTGDVGSRSQRDGENAFFSASCGSARVPPWLVEPVQERDQGEEERHREDTAGVLHVMHRVKQRPSWLNNLRCSEKSFSVSHQTPPTGRPPHASSLSPPFFHVPAPRTPPESLSHLNASELPCSSSPAVSFSECASPFSSTPRSCRCSDSSLSTVPGVFTPDTASSCSSSSRSLLQSCSSQASSSCLLHASSGSPLRDSSFRSSDASQQNSGGDRGGCRDTREAQQALDSAGVSPALSASVPCSCVSSLRLPSLPVSLNLSKASSSRMQAPSLSSSSLAPSPPPERPAGDGDWGRAGWGRPERAKLQAGASREAGGVGPHGSSLPVVSEQARKAVEISSSEVRTCPAKDCGSFDTRHAEQSAVCAEPGTRSDCAKEQDETPELNAVDQTAPSGAPARNARGREAKEIEGEGPRRRENDGNDRPATADREQKREEREDEEEGGKREADAAEDNKQKGKERENEEEEEEEGEKDEEEEGEKEEMCLSALLGRGGGGKRRWKKLVRQMRRVEASSSASSLFSTDNEFSLSLSTSSVSSLEASPSHASTLCSLSRCARSSAAAFSPFPALATQSCAAHKSRLLPELVAHTLAIRKELREAALREAVSLLQDIATPGEADGPDFEREEDTEGARAGREEEEAGVDGDRGEQKAKRTPQTSEEFIECEEATWGVERRCEEAFWESRRNDEERSRLDGPVKAGRTEQRTSEGSDRQGATAQRVLEQRRERATRGGREERTKGRSSEAWIQASVNFWEAAETDAALTLLTSRWQR
ncbi:hypothetical protein TGDOM2_257330 [Toxoplasma gondii GAB2-2007-GAL-DOM2]|uniref:Uncharacterized protein n=6 Tax=Toxoplasma gondii TaxID=5811 RepID=S7UZD7_TOXGG|nr:hypothetical protein TGGT1_257330 [Toxoplasma gondii GT1]KAF4641444.1 hypothetical protein TGRH88_072540 [Toxoplasma gondii]KFG31396.1 hypothetical protein TGDOM2_257330 [Toxoplasma gondii GAB2-2007-GAL-DOM2]KFG53466.1 hypothetical protein TGFOU_257330 [Toxoplasma gondii FOU]PUA85888.1 hypothetical protein TGBR9_257330 [Toxoplasma gondii TgCATBr9]RQX68057.1 hypothetical protein TGCAST_257330 [Toxoplasma gondii CAST]